MGSHALWFRRRGLLASFFHSSNLFSALLSNATLAAWATTKGALLVQSREETWATVVVVVLIVAVVVLWLLCDVLDKHTPHYTRFPAEITE